MLVAHRKQADLLMEVARRGGRQPVNRRYQPPMSEFNGLIRRGNLTITREGPASCRTTMLVLTEKGREETLALARHYGTSAKRL